MKIKNQRKSVEGNFSEDRLKGKLQEGFRRFLAEADEDPEMDMPADELRTRLPNQIKIGLVEKIRDLVNNQLPGITLSSLPVAPRQIPYHAGYHYFQLNKAGNYWEQMVQSGGFAFHLSGQYPALKMEFWSVKGE